MTATDQDKRDARRFLEVLPLVMHSLGGVLQQEDVAGGSVTISQLRSLHALSGGACSLGELASRYEVTAPTMSRLIGTLVDRGWVQRTVDPKDRRQVILTLTDAGQSARKELGERMAAALADLLAQITSEERDCLRQALDGLARVLNARHLGAHVASGDVSL